MTARPPQGGLRFGKMTKRNRDTSGLKPPVRTTEEARALAAQGAGRPALKGGAVKCQVVLRRDQLDALEARGLNRSELVRELLDEYLQRA